MTADRSTDVVVRPLRPDERADWEPLWRGYQVFYETDIPESTTAVTWARLHDPAEPMGALGAYVVNDRLCGIAHYIFHRSCWSVGDYCYLQDLFVADAMRGRGIGRKLIAAVEQVARNAGANRIHWLTQEGNTGARALYDKVAQRSGFIQYRKIF
jgi:GNAT superfamily N-acetyltransferase